MIGLTLPSVVLKKYFVIYKYFIVFCLVEITACMSHLWHLKKIISYTYPKEKYHYAFFYSSYTINFLYLTYLPDEKESIYYKICISDRIEYELTR